MRVLLISHTCLSLREGQSKAACLAEYPDIDLRVLVPDRWCDYGRWRVPEQPAHSTYAFEIGHVRLPWNKLVGWHLHHYPNLPQTLAEFQPEIIDIWEEPYGLVSAHATWMRDRYLPTAKIVLETEQNICKMLPPPFEAFRSYALQGAAFLVGRNDEAVAAARSKGFAGPAAVVPNAVDAELFHPMDRNFCRAKLELSGFVAGYIGRVVEEKGIADLVDAVTYCSKDVNLLIVGGGDYRPALEQRARDAGIASRVCFLPAQPLENLPPIMNALDALVLPSRTSRKWKEQFGRVLIEAQACRTPVIGSSSGAIPDVVGDAGLIVPEGNPKALALALSKLRENPDCAAEMGLNGRRQVEAYFTWNRVAARMREIYVQVG